MDRNVYQFAEDPTAKLTVAGNNSSDLSGYRALWDTIGPETNEDRSIVASSAELLYSVPGGTVQTADLSLSNDSVAAVGLGDAGDSYTPTTDILGVDRGGSPDAGAYECVVAQVDADGDGVADSADNCTQAANPDQCDSNGDGYGNLCDGDINNNNSTGAQDDVLFRQQMGQPSASPIYNVADINCNGGVNSQDYVLFRSLLGSPPGPSGLVP
jgi:hypothetical protein